MLVEADKGESNFPNKSELMADEELMSQVLNSEKLHKKAKIVIYRHLDNLELERQRQGISKDEAKSPDEVEMDFLDCRDKVFELIRSEDPAEAKKLGILPGQLANDEMAGVGVIKQDEESGLEAQVHAIVNEYWTVFEGKFGTRIREVEDSISKELENETEKLNEYLKSRSTEIEKELNMVALQHI